MSVLPTIESNTVELILSDLPYGITKNGWDSVLPLDELFAEFGRVISERGAIVLFASMPFTASLVVAGGSLFKYSLVWSKNKSTGFFNAKKQPLRAHEDILVFYKKPPVYNPQKTEGHKPMNFAKRTGHGTNYNQASKVTFSEKGTTSRYPNSILTFPVVNNDSPERVHPTQKPVELLSYLIRTFSNEGDLVLDVTMGSGSTGVAAVKNNREFIGIEKDEKFFNHASNWIASAKNNERA